MEVLQCKEGKFMDGKGLKRYIRGGFRKLRGWVLSTIAMLRVADEQRKYMTPDLDLK